MRTNPKLIEVSKLKIEFDSDLLKAKPGKRIRIPVNVTNYGETVSIRLKCLKTFSIIFFKFLPLLKTINITK